MQETAGLAKMRSALLAPRNRFDDGGHRSAVVGPELRPRWKRHAEDLGSRHQTGERFRIQIGMGPRECMKTVGAVFWHAYSAAWQMEVVAKEPPRGNAHHHSGLV
ncbi:MAG: hypothetical protein NVS3B6_01990 [Pseudarthrobacter sp.]